MTTPLACPRCHVALALVPHHDRWLAACSQCAGVWLEAREAATLLSPLGSSGLRPTAPAGMHSLACPQCSVAMQALVTPIGAIEIDRCVAHGVWFDRDEMAHVADLVGRMSGRAPKVMPAPYREAVAKPSWGPTAGVLAAGAIVGTAAAIAVGSESSPRERASVLPDAVEGALDGAEVGHAAVEVGTALVDTGGDVAAAAADGAGEAVGAAVEAGGSMIEGAGDVLGGVFEALCGLFS